LRRLRRREGLSSAFDKRAVRKRLFQNVIDAEFESAPSHGVVRSRRNEDRREAATPGSQQLEQFEAGQAWHEMVNDQAPRIQTAEVREQSLGAEIRLDSHPFEFECEAKGVQDRFVIFDEVDSRHSRGIP
jgi:hypothetical protein